MHRFEEPHDPLAERVSDAELREFLERLGEAQFGGDERATVGAIVEATGTEAATVLRLLGEARQRTYDEQRRATKSIESRLRRLEAVPDSVPRGDLFPGRRLEAIVVVGPLALLLALLFIAYAISSASANRQRSRQPYTEPTYTAGTTDGEVVMTPDGSIAVHRRDGTTRKPTNKEEALVEVFALQTHGSR